VRVIAGRLKGRRLAGPTWDGLRPTSDRLRETLFNVLGARVTGARVLDGFAGTGAVGVEAISRGAAHVTFVERDPRALALIARNLAGCGVTSGYTVVGSTFDAAAPALARDRFDLVWLDPPYDAPGLGATLDLAAAWVAPGGLLVLEHAARRPATAQAGSLACVRRIAAGDSALAFYALAPGSGGPETERA
jgi:16S rRNA (guanine(966)-N(2))-methyltransferase RsmD